MSDITSAAQEIFTQFRTKLNELFQMDRAELDFGIYRIMNVKRAEITRYLDHDLFPQVEEILASATSSDVKTAQEELATLEASLKDAGVDPSTSPKVQDLRARLATTTSQDELRQRAFSHLLTFFSRYYDKGDFISKRRYKDGTYMIPYNGEEVKLVWANMDQYYIKTSEYLGDYRFFLNAEKTLRMTFKLVEGDTERDNIKGKNRIFRIMEDEPEGSAPPVTVADDGLVARFEYVLSDTKQKDATAAAFATILRRADRFRVYLEQKDEKSGKTLLEKHLSAYTARNSEDYFIHKDLKGFLERELDFFLKNEVLRIDDMLGDDGEGMQAQLHLARAIKEVGSKIIAMLAQIEEFQKKLWLKRKMVTSTNYLVTLDRIIEKAPQLLPHIAASAAQREEWVQLFAIDEITSDASKLPGMGGVAYSEPLTEEFLRTNNKLVVDTRFFDREFVATLLASFEDIDAETDGLLVHSENFQALRLLDATHRASVQQLYLDPPYNLGTGDFAYKDKYQHSSWASMILQTISSGRRFLVDHGTMLLSIDRNELHRFIEICDSVFSDDNRIAEFAWERGRKNDSKYVSLSHEYFLLYGKSFESLKARCPEWREKKPALKEVRKQVEKLLRKHGNDFESSNREFRFWVGSKLDPAVARSILLYNKLDQRGPYRDDTDMSWPGGGGPRYDVRNPATGDLAVVPSRGWRFVEATMLQLIQNGEVEFASDNPKRLIMKRYYLEDDTQVKNSVLYKHSKAATRLLRNMMGEDAFDNPKDHLLIGELLGYVGEPANTILDFFAGSGTTGHAVINLNREDGGSRKYILVEMGEYFDTVLKPRIAKVVYSTDWKDGKPQSRDTGVSHLVKYIRLESYEDTLNNLTVPEQGEYSSLLEQGVEREFREGYLLGYMLDWEAGAARITTDRFAHPFDSILNVAGDTVGERKPVTIDLVETFNYLIGLTVTSYYEVEGCRIVEGHDPAGDHVLVVWRDLDTTDNAALNDLFLKQRINIRDREFDLIYVNGDNNLENIRRDDETWKVRLIEHEFAARMFSEGDM